ncbi:PREDICTED: uncharacterized protein LOC108565506 [Nicrophorus vespilloides]|uniref:Uncharacterized protein LOC108565506 n=1 Tax=Nicrophorus vespilloides TaxID=110193 RepID=A0ABM1N101_NICVS|nr:PREDICTED: uncharacterized protein LOC108565506 [Nicrophorus vespilloides]
MTIKPVRDTIYIRAFEVHLTSVRFVIPSREEKMFSSKWLIFVCFAAVSAESVTNVRDRQARFFGYRYTSTVIVPKMVTSLLPSSCVQVEPSLPPCRSVRQLDQFPRFLGGRVYAETSENIMEKTGGAVNEDHPIVMPSVHTTALGWGEYLGFYAPTVTVQAVHLQTTTVLDPRTVVTFSVRGCKPSRLPLDLNLCPKKQPEIRPTATASIASTSLAPIIIPDPSGMGAPIVVDDLGLIQPTEHLVPIYEDIKPTENLRSARQ